MSNFPGPWQWRMFYQTIVGTLTRPHEMRVNMDVDTPPTPGSPFADYDLKSRAGLFYNAESWTDAFLALLQPCFPATATFNRAELWLYDDGTNDAAFQSSYTIGLGGTGAGASLTDGQARWTFRSQNGGVAFLDMMEMNNAVTPRLAYPSGVAVFDDVADFLVALDSPAIARDNGYLFVPNALLVGTNEALFKDRLR